MYAREKRLIKERTNVTLDIWLFTHQVYLPKDLSVAA